MYPPAGLAVQVVRSVGRRAMLRRYLWWAALVLSVITVVLIAAGLGSALFQRRDSQVSADFEDVTAIAFQLRENSTCAYCLSPENSCGGTTVHVSQPTVTEFEALPSEDDYLSVHLNFEAIGVLKELWIPLAGDPITRTHTFTSTSSLSEVGSVYVQHHPAFRATRFSLDFGSSDDLELLVRLCAPRILYRPDENSLIVDRWPPGADEGRFLTSFHQFLLGPTQPVTVTVEGASFMYDDDEVTYKMVQFVFVNDPHGSLGQNYYVVSSKEYHGFHGLSKQPYLQLVRADVDSIDLEEPKGQLDLEYDGEYPIDPLPGAYGERHLVLGPLHTPLLHEDSDYSVRAVRDESTAAIVYEIDGHGSSVIWGARELITTRWSALSPELQAAYIAAFLALLAWAANWIAQRASATHSPFSLPAGYYIYHLSTGFTVAGRREAGGKDKGQTHVLTQARLCGPDGRWDPEIVDRINIRPKHVAFSYKLSPRPPSKRAQEPRGRSRWSRPPPRRRGRGRRAPDEREAHDAGPKPDDDGSHVDSIAAP